MAVTDSRARRLRTAVGFAPVPPTEPELRLLHPKARLVARDRRRRSRHGAPGLGRPAHEYDAEGWRATFYVTGAAHSIVGGSAWEPTPWRAVQQAGWAALET